MKIKQKSQYATGSQVATKRGKPRILLVCLLIIPSLLSLPLQAKQISAQLTPAVSVVGETSHLNLIIHGREDVFLDEVPIIDGLLIKLETEASLGSGSQRDTLIQLSIRPIREGNFTLPKIPITVGNVIVESPPLALQVRPPSAITWVPFELGDQAMHYGYRWELPKDYLFTGEQLPVKLVFYLPRSARNTPAKLSFPRTQTTRIAFERLLPANWRSPEAPIGQVRLRGNTYDNFVFAGQATALTSGELTLGPAVAEAEFEILRQRGIQNVPEKLVVPLSAPAVKLTGQSPPTPIPPTFGGAIGKFQLNLQFPPRNLTPGALVDLEIVVSGRGNFDQIPPPILVDAGQWTVNNVRKLNPRNTPDAAPFQNDERTRFQILLTHPNTPAALPAFDLTSFDPESREYHTTRTPKIPLTWLPDRRSPGSPTAPDTAASHPLQANSAFALLPTDYPHSQPLPPDFPSHSSPILIKLSTPDRIAIAGIAVLGLAIPLIIGIHRRRQIKEPFPKLRQALKSLPRSLSHSEFLRKLGTQLETHLAPAQRTETVNHWLKLRDQHCFRPNSSAKPGLDLPLKQRHQAIQAILKSLKPKPRSKHLQQNRPSTQKTADKNKTNPQRSRAQHNSTVTLLALTLSFSTPHTKSHASLPSAPTESSSSMALASSATSQVGQQRPQTTTDLINRGSLAAQSSDWSAAARDFRLALSINPADPEATKRLNLVHQTTSPQLPEPSVVRSSIARIRLTHLRLIALSTAYLTLFSLSLRWASPSTRRSRTYPLTITSLALITTATFGLIHYYPSEYSPYEIERLAIAGPATLGYPAPTPDHPPTPIPETTPLTLVAEYGHWSSVSLPMQSDRPLWVPTEQLIRLTPNTKLN